MGGCHVAVEQAFNLIFGYNADYLQQVVNLAATLGNNFLLSTVVPNDEVWVVSGISSINTTRAITATSGGIYDGSTYHAFFSKASPGLGEVVFCQVPLVVGPGRYIYALFQGCSAGDDIYLNAAGYKMKLTQ